MSTPKTAAALFFLFLSSVFLYKKSIIVRIFIIIMSNKRGTRQHERGSLSHKHGGARKRGEENGTQKKVKEKEEKTRGERFRVSLLSFSLSLSQSFRFRSLFNKKRGGGRGPNQRAKPIAWISSFTNVRQAADSEVSVFLQE